MLPRFVARALLRTVQRRAARRFESNTRQPARVQEETLLRIVRDNRDTEYGRHHGFEQIRSVADFQAHVPLVTATDLAPWMARVVAGEQNVLTSEAPHYFCQTGGTTGEPKFNPITQAYRKEFQEPIYTWSYHLFDRFDDITVGQILYFVGSARLGETPAGIPYGTMSGYNFHNMPGFVKAFYSLPEAISRIGDFETKYYVALRVCLAQDVRMIVSITPSTILVLARKLAEHGDALIEDLERGGLGERWSLPADIERDLRPLLKASPAAARRIREARGSAPLRPTMVWPNLRVLVCWKSGPSAPYLPELERHYGNVPIWDAIYSATEGWMNVPLQLEQTGGALAVGTHFFEFFDEQDEARQGPPRLAAELEKGKRYAIVLTSSSGMYRYDIKDIVTCVGFHNATPVIAFSHKEAGFSNVVGEKLSDHHVNTAIAAAAAVTQRRVVFFAMAPVPASAEAPPHYRAHVELDGGVDDETARSFLAAIEESLRDSAWEYRSHRDGGDLGAVDLALLSAGSGDAHRAAFMAGGGNEAQMKPTHLVPDLERLSHLEVDRTVRL